MSQEDILNMISVNIKGMTLIQKMFLPYMKKDSYTIITCLVSSFVPVSNQTVYSATKKYIYYFGKALREELLEKDINVLLLCPGNMDTEMNPKGQGRGVYTPGMFYKSYRVVSKIFPSLLMMKLTKRFY